MLAWELIGAVIGAGMASGREIASFFSQYGTWSFAGILIAVLVMVFLADAAIPLTWRNRWPANVWKVLLSFLLIATGGAMLSGAGEVAALTLPLHGAYWLGMAVTLILSWYLAQRTITGLAWVSRILLAVLAVLITLGLTLSPMKAAPINAAPIPEALLRALTYGGFNAALQTPIMLQAVRTPKQQTRKAVLSSGLLILLLLLLGNAVLLRHPALLGEPMPFIRMMANFGHTGYVLGAISLYLSILSTLTASLRGLEGRMWSMIAIILVALFGFSGVVEVVYPLLGGGCLVMLAAAKFTNCSSNPFISRRDML